MTAVEIPPTTPALPTRRRFRAMISTLGAASTASAAKIGSAISQAGSSVVFTGTPTLFGRLARRPLVTLPLYPFNDGRDLT